MNNCFINSILNALNNLNKLNEIFNSYDDELFYYIKQKNSNKINELVFKTRINNTQEDAEEFLSNKLLPKFKNYILKSTMISLSNKEKNIINEFIQYNKSKIFDFLRKYNYFDNNKIFYEYFYDFYDDIKFININNYIKNFTIGDYFINYYIDLNNNELVKSFTIHLNNNNIKNILQNIYFLKITQFIILNINYVDNTNFVIPNILNNNINKYNLKSIIYYISFSRNQHLKISGSDQKQNNNLLAEASSSGHYYNINVDINNKYNAINIMKNSKAKLLFYEKI